MTHPQIPGTGPRGQGHWYDAYSRFLTQHFPQGLDAPVSRGAGGPDPLGVADPTVAHPGADQCAVCTKARGQRDREWNSSGTWWCPECKDAYAAFRDEHPIPAGPTGLASQMPTYMYAPAYWPGLGFALSDLDPYRPSTTAPPHPNSTQPAIEQEQP